MKSKKLKKIIAIAIVGSITSTIMPVAASAEWLRDSNNNWGWIEDGNKATGWKQVGGTWYYFDNNGDMKTGWVQSSDYKWYYLNTDGAMKTGWLKTSDGKWYNLGADGAMRIGWLQDSNGSWYKLANSGEMKTGWIEDSDGKWYFANSSGVMQTGIIQVEGKSYALAESGEMLVGTNVLTEGNTYTTDANGVIIQGNSSSDKKFTNEGVLITPSESSGDSTTATTNTNASTETSKSHHSSSSSRNLWNEIIKVHTIDDVNVANGTELNAINLPSKISVTLDNNRTMNVAVTWDKGNPIYDENNSGTYSFSGTLTLPNGIKNSSNLKATVNVNVSEAEVTEKSVIGVHSISDINVNEGTSLDELNLPQKIHVTLSDNTTTSAAVTWNEGTPAYDADTAGTYTFSGQLTLPEDITNPNNLIATVNVNVASADTGDKEVLRINSISDINVDNGTSLEDLDLPNRARLTLGDNTTTSAAVTWDEGTPTYDGSVAGSYIFSGELTLPEGITNPNNLKAIAQVNVAAANVQKSIISVNQIPDINVSNGTSLDAANLPSDVIVILDDNTTTSAAVTWHEGTPTYDGDVAGTYTFIGTLTLPEGITNPNNLRATVNVIVGNPIIATGMTVTVAPKTTPQDGRVMLTVTPGAEDATHKLYYRIVNTDPTAMNVGNVITISDWAEVTDTTTNEISVADGKYVEVVEVTNSDNKVTRWGKSSATNDGYTVPVAPAIFEVNTLTTANNGLNDDGKSSVTVTWTDSATSTVDHYEIVAKVGSTPAVTDTVIGKTDIAVGTQTASFDWTAGEDLYVGVVSVDANGLKTLCTGTTENVTVISDGHTPVVPTVKVGNLAFTDTDTDANKMSGTLTWTPPADVSNVTDYAVYASADGTTKGTQIGSDVPVGTNQLVIPTDTSFAPYIIVVAKNATGEAVSDNYANIGVTDVMPTAVIVSNDSVQGATAGDSKVTGLTPGRAYKITDNSTGISQYTKADGTLTADVSQEAALGNGVTEITGLTNGKTYKVEDIKINSIGQLNDITVVYGTELDSVELPSQVSITLNDNRTINTSVTWDMSSTNYGKDVEGTYTFNGIIELPIGVANPSNLNTTVNVIVSKDIALNKTATASAFQASNQAASKAVDGSIDYKWCTTRSGDNWLKLDLGKSYEIGRWVVKHAHAGKFNGEYEPAAWNTRDFKLQKSDDGQNNWVDVDTVTGNTADITDRNVNPFTTRYVRLYVTNPVQPGQWAAVRIFELELYKDQNPTVPTVKVSNLAFTDIDNDANQIGGTLTWTAPSDEANVTSYAVYESTDGITKGAEIGTVLVGTNQLVIPENTAYTPYMVVAAKNVNGEATSTNYANIKVTDVVQTLDTPTLVADTSNANVDNNIDITFTDNEAWRNAIIDVKIDNQSVGSGNWTLSAGKLTLTTSAITALHMAGSKEITIVASGYGNTTVIQNIASGNLSSTESTVTVIPTTYLPNGGVLAAGYTSDVIINARDKYDNPISGKQFKFDINITNENSYTEETYIIDGNTMMSESGYGGYIDRANLRSKSGTNGEATFKIAIPNSVDSGDGFTLNIEDANNGDRIGSGISYYQSL